MSTVKKFQKREEDFVCENCGFDVSGNGFTNHCPKCLWSKHVDIFPGDRLEPCQGMMAPIGVTKSRKGEDQIVHECSVCGYRKNNMISKDDDIDEVVEISKKPVSHSS